MLSKLALRNVGRSLRDYAVYFFTLTFGVCLFYVFNSLESQNVMSLLAATDHYSLEGIFTILGVLSVFVTAVLAGLILYANQFLIKRRKRELGTYFLLGMDTAQVSRLLVGETLLIGLCALLTGLPLGFLASWGLDRLTAAMFLAVEPDLFTFSLSWAAVGKTALYFGAIFLLVMLFTGFSVSRAELIDLLQSHRRNEEVSRRPLCVSVALFVLGCLSLGTAYAILLLRGLLAVDLLWFGMLGLGTAGTFLIFRSLSGFILRLTKGHRGYYRGLNMFVLRQWSGKVHTNCLSNTVLSILLLLAMGATACSVGLNDTITATAASDAPFDLTLTSYNDTVDFQLVDPMELLRSAGGTPEEWFSAAESFPVYYNDRLITGNDNYSLAIAKSDYDRLMAGRSLPALEAPLPTPVEQPIDNAYGAGEMLVISDETAAQLPMQRQAMNFTFRGDPYETYRQVSLVVERLEGDTSLTLWGSFRLDAYFQLMGSKLLVLYIGLYLGLVFLLTAAAVLALQQLSQAADNAARYRLLSKLGAPEPMRRAALVSQVGLAFLLPLALGVIHTLVGMTAANDVISQAGRVDSVRSSLFTAGALLLIYGGYFLFTCLGAWRAVRSEK